MTDERLKRCSKRSLKEEEDEESSDQETGVAKNKFANDGSFMELIKKMEEEREARLKTESNNNSGDCVTKDETKHANETANVSTVKRRSKVLKIGVIKRDRRLLEDTDEVSGDAWQQYMNEVRKYKDKFGDDSDKNRPLVK
ncbi:hypothetical protein B4U80_10783 [Leptotrombidium deliense]|uniref:Uncharacterized protein n=1 Tax=Leptotrombidium deliense TaxID=299467 RepID=A0A443STR5_9ACAR|nr:hypothetical protein B4U80_10783 [Leptotrombidium deliense]